MKKCYLCSPAEHYQLGCNGLLNSSAATEEEINLYLTSVCLFPGSQTVSAPVDIRFQCKISLIPDPTRPHMQTLDFQSSARILVWLEFCMFAGLFGEPPGRFNICTLIAFLLLAEPEIQKLPVGAINSLSQIKLYPRKLFGGKQTKGGRIPG